MLRTFTLLLAGILPLFGLILFISFLLFDRLLGIQFSDARSEWEKQGRPSGYFWSPPGSQKLSMQNRGHLFSQWFYCVPAWARGSQEASKLYSWFRLLTVLQIIVGAPILFAFAVLIPSIVDLILTKLFGFSVLRP